MLPCIGLCGERCVHICPSCDLPSKASHVVVNTKTLPFPVKITNKTQWIRLEDCKHLLPVRSRVYIQLLNTKSTFFFELITVYYQGVRDDSLLLSAI